MRTTGKLQRQSLGCGFEAAPPPTVPIMMWQPPAKAYSGPPPTMCAGYSTNLPEVIEALVARVHWSKGNVAAACDGEQPGEDLLNSILILEGASNDVQQWLMTPAKDGGGGG